ncbi:hypothetical protein ACFVUS_00905 [Nocardia sp. NPDC058058]|uniref:hypothetical protein n=1 Tax=Nocardia sp. NPDC058058 TaxID=3346317 RepID=UPI0036DDC2A0
MSPISTPFVVCIAGGDASGKSTQVAAVAKTLRDQGISTAEAGIWDALDDPVIAARLPFRDRDEVFGYLRVLRPSSRALFLFHAVQVAVELAAAAAPEVILLNAYWYKYFATEVAHGGDPAALRAHASGFAAPDLTCYLKVSPGTALARKIERSDYESGYGDAEKFLEFQQQSQTVLDGLSRELGWHELDGTAEPGILTRTIAAAIPIGVAP